MKTLLIHILVFVISCVCILCVSNEVLKGAFAGAIATELLFLVTEFIEKRHDLNFMLWSVLHPNAEVYVSVAALVRIRNERNYLLIYSTKRNQFHPIGGALWWSEVVKPPFPYTPKADPREMRFDVKGRYIATAVQWLCAGRDREVSPWRELYEELVLPGIVDSKEFPFVPTRFVRRGLHLPVEIAGNSNKFEMRIFEIHEAELNAEQIEKLKTVAGPCGSAADPQRTKLCWFRDTEIPEYINGKTTRIGTHALELTDS